MNIHLSTAVRTSYRNRDLEVSHKDPCFVFYEEAEEIISDLAEQTPAEVGVSYRECYASNQFAFAER